MEPPADPQVALQNRIDRLHKVIPPDAEPWRETDFVVEFGNASDQILNVAQERNADLIVLGAKFAGHVAAATHLASATAHTVVSHATCPVLTVRA